MRRALGVWLCGYAGCCFSPQVCSPPLVFCCFCCFLSPQVARLGGSEFRWLFECADIARLECAALWICRLLFQPSGVDFSGVLLFLLFSVTAGGAAVRFGVTLAF